MTITITNGQSSELLDRAAPSTGLFGSPDPEKRRSKTGKTNELVTRMTGSTRRANRVSTPMTRNRGSLGHRP